MINATKIVTPGLRKIEPASDPRRGRGPGTLPGRAKYRFAAGFEPWFGEIV